MAARGCQSPRSEAGSKTGRSGPRAPPRRRPRWPGRPAQPRTAGSRPPPRTGGPPAAAGRASAAPPPEAPRRSPEAVAEARLVRRSVVADHQRVRIAAAHVRIGVVDRHSVARPHHLGLLDRGSVGEVEDHPCRSRLAPRGPARRGARDRRNDDLRCVRHRRADLGEHLDQGPEQRLGEEGQASDGGCIRFLSQGGSGTPRRSAREHADECRRRTAAPCYTRSICRVTRILDRRNAFLDRLAPPRPPPGLVACDDEQSVR
jgi:hypothetical protein